MTKRRLLRWSLLLVILAAFAVWLEPTRVVWGWLRGQAFYQGRPTSWWRWQLNQPGVLFPLQHIIQVGETPNVLQYFVWESTPTWFDALAAKFCRNWKAHVRVFDPSVPEANAVVQELLNDSSWTREVHPAIRILVESGIEANQAKRRRVDAGEAASQARTTSTSHAAEDR